MNPSDFEDALYRLYTEWEVDDCGHYYDDTCRCDMGAESVLDRLLDQFFPTDNKERRARIEEAVAQFKRDKEEKKIRDAEEQKAREFERYGVTNEKDLQAAKTLERAQTAEAEAKYLRERAEYEARGEQHPRDVRMREQMLADIHAAFMYRFCGTEETTD